MRLLFLKMGDHLVEGSLERLQLEGALSNFETVDYVKVIEELGRAGFWDFLVDKVVDFQPDVVFFNFFHIKQDVNAARYIELIKNIPSRPVIVVSSGDPFSGNWMLPHYPKSFRQVALAADIIFSTQMGRVALSMKKWGAKNIVLLPHSGYSARFPEERVDLDAYKPEFNVVFVGSNLKSRNPLGKHFYASRRRREMVALLAKRYGNTFGLFGYGWEKYDCWQGAIPFAEQVSAYLRGRIVFGGAPHSYEDYYMSDRPFFAIGSGVPVVDSYVPRADRIFRDGDHWHLVRSKDDLCSVCDSLLEEDSSLLMQRAALAQQYVWDAHSQYKRLQFAVKACGRMREARSTGNKCPVPVPDFFLPDVDLEHELQYAVCNWKG